MKISYEYFVEDLAGEEDVSIIYFINKFVEKENIKLFYPKNLFTDKKLKAHLFLDNQIFIFENNQDLKIRVFNYDQVKNFELITEGRYKPLNLNVFLSTGETLEFNSVNDTNQHWGRSFSEEVEDIFKLLIQKTSASETIVKQ
ncbi:hypothetical protein ABE65_010415 [Fictibacillus phosphorivorans]|uniref:Uncharacterized protein n=1 Tax=Fictibacillus phosphorivorans TaxID=1221500 RepID=A0A160ILU3_9BACL|nr:DUF3908 family protein [Fictibacillus phosphorivorans]ANC77193.1 hypothetical protein ABE65_010415 [Fictibacillus phosphorivorans]